MFERGTQTRGFDTAGRRISFPVVGCHPSALFEEVDTFQAGIFIVNGFE